MSQNSNSVGNKAKRGWEKTNTSGRGGGAGVPSSSKVNASQIVNKYIEGLNDFF